MKWRVIITIEKQQLNEMQQHQRWEKRIQMDVKTVAPFDVTIRFPLAQILVGEDPCEWGHNDAHHYKIDNYDVEYAIDGLAEWQV